jgi:hypothetical protein
MRTVTCKELGSVTAISVGTTYNVIEESGSRYTIINDKGVQANYGKNLFNNPVEVREEPVAEAQPARARRGRPAGVRQAEAPVVPAPIRVVDEIEIETRATSDDGRIKFTTVFDFGENSRLEHAIGEIITASGVSASCGIQSIDGIDSLANYIHTLRDQFTSFVERNRGVFTLSPDFNTEDMFSSISGALLQDIISTFQGGDAEVRAALLLVSTTEDNLRNSPALREALDTASSSSTPAVVNPNSGNSIISWMIPVEA